jgi:hypothetical protein
MKGYIYFIACLPMSACKIGFTSGPARKRLAAMQTGCPAPLKLYATVPGTIAEERLLHQAFRPLHIHGEWFRFEAKLLDIAYYLSGDACRDVFEAALHDVLFEGIRHQNNPAGAEEYARSGDWMPFEHIVREFAG